MADESIEAAQRSGPWGTALFIIILASHTFLLAWKVENTGSSNSNSSSSSSSSTGAIYDEIPDREIPLELF